MSSPRWTGKTLGGRYQVEELLGQGGMSTVYKARDPHLNRAVAIKLMHPHLADVSGFVDRFREEASAVAQMRHPNIVQVFDFNRDGDDFYMVMEFVPGETLRARLDRLKAAGRDLPLSEAIRYTNHICAAADYAHQRGLIHRDIKPANVILDLNNQAILMDFGIAKILGGPQYTATGATVGTALYMSPEQIRGERVDERSDIYAIGVTLFELISGHPPYQAQSSMTLLMMHLNDPVPDLSQLRPDVPAGLRLVVEQALAKDRANRFQSAGQMQAALNQALTDLQGSLQAPTALGTLTPGLTSLPGDITMPPRARPPEASSPTSVPGSAASSTQGDRPVSPTPAEMAGPAGAARASAPPSNVAPPIVSRGRSNKGLWIVGILFLIGIVTAIGLLLLNRSDGEADLAATHEFATNAAVTEAALAATNHTPTSEPPSLPAAVPIQTTAPTATPEPTPTPTLAPTRLGLMAFNDNDQARAGSFQLTIAEAGSPAAGSQYELWFTDGQEPVFQATSQTSGGLFFAVDTVENLLANYSSAFITLEPEGHEGSTPTGQTVYVGFISPGALEQIRLLVGTAADNPEGKAFLVGADEQARLAQEHAGYLQDELANGHLNMARLHAEHVINILSGETDDAFGDLDGDGLAQNPGDGFGVIAYLEGAQESARLAAEAPGASEEVQLHSDHVLIASDNSLTFLAEAVRAASRVLASDSVAEAQTASQVLNQSLEALLNGVDVDNDGVISPTPGEGGLKLTYEHALKMGSFEFFNAQDVPSGAD